MGWKNAFAIFGGVSYDTPLAITLDVPFAAAGSCGTEPISKRVGSGVAKRGGL
jgi:hypothetical protein